MFNVGYHIIKPLIFVGLRGLDGEGGDGGDVSGEFGSEVVEVW